jgi:hypothetical protein
MKQLLDGLDDDGIGIDELRSLGGGEARRTQPCTGTRALMLAVLEDAINSYFNGKGRPRAEAEQWIALQRRHSPFSFVVICETLGLEPPAVRDALRRTREQLGPERPARRVRPNVRRHRLTW